jgi:hypothetical protein
MTFTSRHTLEFFSNSYLILRADTELNSMNCVSRVHVGLQELERGGIVILRCDPFKNRTPKQNIIKLDKF